MTLTRLRLTAGAKARHYTSDKPGSGGTVFLVAGGAETFVHRAQRQPPARQNAIDRVNSEGQDTMRGWLLNRPNALAKRR